MSIPLFSFNHKLILVAEALRFPCIYYFRRTIVITNKKEYGPICTEYIPHNTTIFRYSLTRLIHFRLKYPNYRFKVVKATSSKMHINDWIIFLKDRKLRKKIIKSIIPSTAHDHNVWWTAIWGISWAVFFFWPERLISFMITDCYRGPNLDLHRIFIIY